MQQLNILQQENRLYSSTLIVRRLKRAAADPASLTQETIIDNLDAVEKGRLARIRNIGIAVCTSLAWYTCKANGSSRPILIAGKPQRRSEFSSILEESMPSTKFAVRML